MWISVLNWECFKITNQFGNLKQKHIKKLFEFYFLLFKEILKKNTRQANRQRDELMPVDRMDRQITAYTEYHTTTSYQLKNTEFIFPQNEILDKM